MKIMVVKDRNVLNTKFVAQFVNDLAGFGHEVLLVCDSYRKAGEGVILDPRVQFINLSGKTANPMTNLVRWIRSEVIAPVRRYHRYIQRENPDIVVCYFPKDFYNALSMNSGRRPAIQMLHCYPPLMVENLKKKNRRKSQNLLKSLEQADVLQVLNKSFIEPLRQCIDAKRIVAIPNSVEQIPPEERVDLTQEKKKIIYVARLDKGGKRQHLLIDAFAQASRNVPGWTLEFWGLQKSEAYKKELIDQARALGVGERVFIKGYNPNIREVYRNADINAFPSRYEGFGLALADGMAMGLPSIGFEETPSVNELIKDGSNGFLAADTDDFARKLAILMSDRDLRISMGQQAAKDMEAYAPEIVAAQWNRLIEETVHNTGTGTE